MSLTYDFTTSACLVSLAVIDSRKRRHRAEGEESDDEPGTYTNQQAGSSLFTEKRRQKGKLPTKKLAQSRQKCSKEELLQLEQQKESEAARAYARVKQLWNGMLNGEGAAEKEWLIEAEKLVEMFRETRALFTVQNVGVFGSLKRTKSNMNKGRNICELVSNASSPQRPRS